MTDTALLTLANTCAQAAIGTLQRQRGELPNTTTHKLFDDISALIVAAYAYAEPDVRKIAAIARDSANDKLIVFTELDLAPIRRKAALARLAEVEEITLYLSNYTGRHIGFVNEAQLTGWLMSEEDLETIDDPVYTELAHSDGAPVDLDDAAATDDYLGSFEARMAGHADLDAQATVRLYVNTETLGASLEVLDGSEDGRWQSQGFNLEGLDLKPFEPSLPEALVAPAT